MYMYISYTALQQLNIKTGLIYSRMHSGVSYKQTHCAVIYL